MGCRGRLRSESSAKVELQWWWVSRIVQIKKLSLWRERSHLHLLLWLINFCYSKEPKNKYGEETTHIYLFIIVPGFISGLPPHLLLLLMLLLLHSSQPDPFLFILTNNKIILAVRLDTRFSCRRLLLLLVVTGIHPHSPLESILVNHFFCGGTGDPHSCRRGRRKRGTRRAIRR